MQKVTLKVIYLSDDFPPDNLGGAGMIAYEEAVGVASRGHDVLVITTTSDPKKVGETMQESKGENFRVIRLFSNYDARWRSYVSMWNFRLVGEVKKILEKEKADVIHAHNIHTHFSYKVLDVARRNAAKVFLTAHDAMLVHYGKFLPSSNHGLKAGGLKNFKEYGLRYNPLLTFAARHYSRCANAVFAVSDALKEVLVANGITNVHVLHNGIDATRWMGVDDGKKKDYIQKFGLENKKVILFAGRISGLKGGKVIQDAFRKIYEKRQDVRLLVVGKSEEESGEPGVIFSGPVPRDDMKYMYSIADVVAVPSLYLDPFPTVNLEAMASGKLVVGTSYGGTKEAVLDGHTGYIVDPNNTSLFAQRIGEVLSDDEKRGGMGEAAHARFEKHFTITTHLDALLAWYNLASR